MEEITREQFNHSGTDQVGRCEPCGFAYVWKKGQVPLTFAHCLMCGRHLAQTTRLLKTGRFARVSPHAIGERASCPDCDWERRYQKLNRALRAARSEEERVPIRAEMKAMWHDR